MIAKTCLRAVYKKRNVTLRRRWSEDAIFGGALMGQR